jgi:hypothetical protein
MYNKEKLDPSTANWHRREREFFHFYVEERGGMYCEAKLEPVKFEPS